MCFSAHHKIQSVYKPQESPFNGCMVRTRQPTPYFLLSSKTERVHQGKPLFSCAEKNVWTNISEQISLIVIKKIKIMIYCIWFMYAYTVNVKSPFTQKFSMYSLYSMYGNNCRKSKTWSTDCIRLTFEYGLLRLPTK